MQMRSPAALAPAALAAVTLLWTSFARADEPLGLEPASAPAPAAPADPPLRAAALPAGEAAEPPDGITFGVQLGGGLGPSLSFLGFGLAGSFGLPVSFGLAPGLFLGPLHLRLVLSFAREGTRSVNDFGGTRIVNSSWATAFTALPEAEITIFTFGAARAFVLAGAQVGVVSTLDRTDDGTTVTRTTNTSPAFGLLGGLGFRLMIAWQVGLGATGGLQWFAITDSDPSSDDRTTDATFNVFGTIDLTAFFGGL